MAGQGTGYFGVRRLHSLAGILLAVSYFVFFLIPMSAALGGPQAFNRLAAQVARFPFIDAIAILCVVAPLVLHLIVGVSIIYGSQFNVVSFGFYRNWMYALQRLTGIVLIPFLLYHVVKTGLAFAFTERVADYAVMHALLLPGWAKALYGAGVVCAAFHIGNGLAVALVRWGIAVSRRSQDAAVMAMWIVTLILAAWGLGVVFAF